MGADLLAWAFHSPRRLLTVLVCAVVAVLAAVSLWGSAPGSAEVPVTTAPSAAVPDPAPAVAAAVAFVDRWGHADPSQTQAQWRAAVAPLATPQLGEALALTDLSSLPGAKADGEPVVRFLARGSALIAVPLTGGERVVVTVVSTGGSWLASDVQPDVGDGP